MTCILTKIDELCSVWKDCAFCANNLSKYVTVFVTVKDLDEAVINNMIHCYLLPSHTLLYDYFFSLAVSEENVEVLS